MNIYYSAASGSSNHGQDELTCEVIPEILSHLSTMLYKNIYNPESSVITSDFTEVAENIVKADIFIGEMSRASQTLGFELAHALNHHKPCLYLYHEDRSAKPGTVLLHSPSRLMKIKAYNEKNIEKIIKNFIKFSEKHMNTSRTSFMSTRKIDEFLNIQSSRRGVSKGELIREVLSKAADK